MKRTVYKVQQYNTVLKTKHQSLQFVSHKEKPIFLLNCDKKIIAKILGRELKRNIEFFYQ